MENEIGETIYKVAPKEAPLAVPSVNGEAMGLRNRDWKTAPLIARTEPVIRASKALGNLILKKISVTVSE